jgi:hypothetical protein
MKTAMEELRETLNRWRDEIANASYRTDSDEKRSCADELEALILRLEAEHQAEREPCAEHVPRHEALSLPWSLEEIVRRCEAYEALLEACRKYVQRCQDLYGEVPINDECYRACVSAVAKADRSRGPLDALDKVRSEVRKQGAMRELAEQLRERLGDVERLGVILADEEIRLRSKLHHPFGWASGLRDTLKTRLAELERKDGQ